MVLMRRLTIEVDDATCRWIERRRGSARPEEFAARAIAACRARDDRGADAGTARAHADIGHRIDQLGQRIQRLDRELRDRRAADAKAQLR
ncbi:MAG TPA: hypothetical protein VLT35_06430 [Methanocella sp.]|nr:hypothetical protein [Methanocella sp.]